MCARIQYPFKPVESPFIAAFLGSNPLYLVALMRDGDILATGRVGKDFRLTVNNKEVRLILVNLGWAPTPRTFLDK